MKMPSVMGQGHFAQVPKVQIPRSQFDRSHGYKTTLDAGYLYPFFTDEVLPGDTMKYSMSGFARMTTPLKPIMDNMYLETFFFFVPLRLLWDNFERFMGAQDTPGASTDFLIPQLAQGTIAPGSLGDYFGLPTDTALTSDLISPNAWMFRAYNLIFNEWFRDENLVQPSPIHTDDGPDPNTDYPIRRRGKRHDYFTSALPFPQKGPAVTIPAHATTGAAAPVVPITPGAVPVFRNAAGSTGGSFQTTAAGETPTVSIDSPTGSWGAGVPLGWSDTKLVTNVGAALGTINQLRQAVQIQRLYEREARGGTRYTEQVRSLFGVTSPDARLQRPEYLGGGSTAVTISPVAQTAPQPTSGAIQTPQGNLAATGQVSWQGHGFAKSFTEHGVLIGLLSIRADITYQRYLDRQWFRRTKLDMFLPPLANLGEQVLFNKEIFFTGTTATDDAVFGYQERYAEYRYKNSLVTGKFRSEDPQSLDVWHLAQEYTAVPVLGETFISENPPIARVVAVPTEPHFLLDTYAHYVCARPMPVFGVPGMMDHF